MDINYTVYPTPPAALAPAREHWLVSIAEGLRYADKSDDKIWVLRDRAQEWVTYLLRSQRTKVTAQLQGQGNKILVTIFQQADVDPANIVLPKGEVTGTNTFEMNSNASLRQAVGYLSAELSRETLYTRGVNKRIHLALRPHLAATPPIFFGGIIEAVSLDEVSVVDEAKGEMRNALLLVSDGASKITIRVGTMPLSFQPEQYRPGTRGLASRHTSDYHERVYTFSLDSLHTYYQLESA